MFDANARGFAKGCFFYVKVWGVDDGTRLAREGVKTGDLLRCKMRDVNDRSPRVKIFLPNGGSYTPVENYENYDQYWLVFEGTPDGDSFLDMDSRKKVLKMEQYRLRNRGKLV